MGGKGDRRQLCTHQQESKAGASTSQEKASRGSACKKHHPWGTEGAMGLCTLPWECLQRCWGSKHTQYQHQWDAVR